MKIYPAPWFEKEECEGKASDKGKEWKKETKKFMNDGHHVYHLATLNLSNII